MSTENQKFGFTVAAENEASQTFQQIGNDADKMAAKVNQAGQKAAEGVGAIGAGAEDAAERMTRAETRIAAAMRKATEETQLAAQAAKSLSGSFELKMDMRGMDASRLQPYIQALRDAESQLSVYKAAEAELGKQDVFAEKHRQAQQLTKSAEYVRFWTAELDKSEAKAKELAGVAAFATQHEDAKKLVKDAEYVRFWNQELERSAAAEKKAAGENAFLQSLREQSSAIGKTRADLLELQAAQMGVATQAAPMIAKLREAEGGVGKMGMSAAALNAALRNVPAQFTDIVVSLQAGQAPLTVLLQQGGQLKDMFGGVGQAAKALGGYVLGLVNPFTVGAAAVAGFALAAYSAEKSLRTEASWQTYAAATGRAADLSVESFKRIRAEMALLPGVNKAMAAEVIGDLANMRDLSTGSLKGIASVASDVAVVMRTDMPTAAKALGKALQDPAKGVSELNETLRIFSASQIATIEAMVEMGDKAGAQSAILDALKQSTNGLAKQGLTPLQEATNEFGNTWDTAMASLSGAGGTLRAVNELMAGLVKHTSDAVGWLSRLKLSKEMEDLFKGGLNGMVYGLIAGAPKQPFTGGATGGWGASAGGATGGWGEPSKDPEAAAWDQRVQSLRQATDRYKATSQQMTDLRKNAKDLSETIADLVKKGDGQSDLAKKLRENLAGVNEQLVNLEKRNKGPSGGGVKVSDTRMAGLEAQLEAARQYGKQLQELGLAAKDLNAGERESLKISAEMEKATDAKTLAKLKNAKATADEIGQQLRSNDTTEENLKAKDALIKSMYKSADATAQETARLEASLSVYGKSQVEIERLTLAKLQQHKADVGLIANLEYIAALEKQIQEQAGKVGGLERTELKKFSETMGKSLEAAKEELAIQQDGLSLLGMDEAARRKILAVRKIDLAVAKQIAEVDKTKYSDDGDENERQRAARRKLIWEKAEVDTQVAIGRIQEEYAVKNAEKYNDIFRQGFADFVNNGADGLKAFGKSLKTTILTSASDALYKAFAQKFVMNVAANVTGLVGAGAGWLASLFGGGSDGPAGGNVGNLISAGSTGYNLYTGEGLIGQGSRYLANLAGFGGAAPWQAAGVQATGAVTTPVTGGLGAAAPQASWASSATEWVSSGGWVMAVPLIAAYLGGMFKEEKQVGSGITGELGGDLYGYQLMRESGSLFGGPKYRYLVAEKEIEKSKAEIERLKKEIADNPDDKRNAYRETQIQRQYSRLEMLSQYDGSIEGSKGPIKILQDAFMGMREDTAARADSLGLDGDSIRAMKVTLGLDEIHPDTGGKGLELTGLTQEEATAKVQAALGQANEELARSVLGKWETQTREVTRMVWDDVELPSDGDTQQYGRVGREMTETVTEQVFVMSEYVRTGETAVQALTRLSDSLYSVNTVFDMLGVTLMDTSLAGADMASNIIDAFGGADKFSAATSNYYDKFYTDQEKVKNQTRLLNDQLKKLGIETMPTSREALREYINGIDLSTEQGRKLYASLLGLVDVFDMIYTSAENIASLKGDLQIQLLRAKGNDAEATRLERAKQIKELQKYNDPELVKLQVEIWDTEDKAKADEAAKTLAQQNLQAAISREKEYWTQFATDAKDAFTKASSYVDLFSGSAKSLRAGLDDMANSQAAAGMVFIEQALENARRGLGFGDYDQTQNAINDATGGLVMDNYASQAELDYDKKVLAGQLDELGEFAELAKTDAQKQIDLATSQLKRLDDIQTFWQTFGEDQVDATLSVTDAVNALYKLLDPKEQERIKKEEAAKAGLDGGGAKPSTTPTGGGSLGGSVTGSNRVTVVGLTADGRPIFSNGEVGKTPAGQTSYNSTGQMNSNGYSLAEFEKYKASGEFELDPKTGEWRKRASFAVGIDYVPYDMTANIHKGERIFKASDNRALMEAVRGQSRGPDSAAGAARVEAILLRVEAALGAGNENTRKLSDNVDRVTNGGSVLTAEVVNRVRTY